MDKIIHNDLFTWNKKVHECLFYNQDDIKAVFITTLGSLSNDNGDSNENVTNLHI